MKAFWAHMHVGHTIEFAGDSWEEGGFDVDADGNPAHDPRGNTVAGYRVDDLTGPDAGRLDDDACRLIYEAGVGDNRIDRDEFVGWLEGEGYDPGDVATLVAYASDALTQRCAYCDRAVKYRDPEKAGSGAVPAKDDDDAWEELAEEHEDDCEWITTRAHRVEVA